MICSDCGVDHSDLVGKWPVGSQVKVKAQISAWLTKVKIGTAGRIIEHCDDGRPLIYFDRYGSHSFHQPEQFFDLSGYKLSPTPNADDAYSIRDEDNQRVALVWDKELGQRIADFLNSEAR